LDTLGTQITAFLTTILAGFTIGVMFDVYRLIRSGIRPGHFLTTVMDVLFWIIATPVVVVELVVANWLELRFYVLLGVALGLFLYFSVFSPLFLALLLTAVEVIAAAFRSIVVGLGLLISAPIRFLRSLGLRYRLARPFSKAVGWTPFAVRWRPSLFGRIHRR